MAIRKAGAKLVSVNENIDESPSGKFLYGIMAEMAEFYSANLSQEIRKGLDQKAKVGGTLTRAPLGYPNVREMVRGREVRTVVIDPVELHLSRGPSSSTPPASTAWLGWPTCSATRASGHE